MDISYEEESRIVFSITRKLERLVKILSPLILGLMRGYRSIISVIKPFYQSLYWILESVGFHDAIFTGNEICSGGEKWTACKKRPRLRKRKARKRKSGINYGRIGIEARGAKNTSRPAVTFSSYLSIESYVHSAAGVSVR